jgi:tetratricopeptide (TPR) repeat protein
VVRTPQLQQERQPWSPTKKIVWGILLCWLVPVGEIMIAVGIYQMLQPSWKARNLVVQAEKQPSLARSLIDKALALDPKSPQALKAKGHLQYASSEWDAAAETYGEYLGWMPQDWTAIANQAQAYLNAGLPQQAIDKLQLLTQNAPLADESQASVAAHLAIAFLALGDTSQALEVVKAQPLQRRTLDAGLEQCLFVRAVAQYGLGQRAGAIRDLDRLYAINPGFPNLQEIKGQIASGEYRIEEIGEVQAARASSFTGARGADIGSHVGCLNNRSYTAGRSAKRCLYAECGRDGDAGDASGTGAIRKRPGRMANQRREVGTRASRGRD